MNNFVQHHAASGIGVLSGFDQVLFGGTLMRLCNGGGRFDLMRKTGHVRRENCFTQLSDVLAAQELMSQQLSANWPQLLGDIAGWINPAYPAE